MTNIPTADTIMRNAVEVHARALLEKCTATQVQGFYRFYPKGLDGLPLDKLKEAHALIRRTVVDNGPADEERID